MMSQQAGLHERLIYEFPLEDRVLLRKIDAVLDLRSLCYALAPFYVVRIFSNGEMPAVPGAGAAIEFATDSPLEENGFESSVSLAQPRNPRDGVLEQGWSPSIVTCGALTKLLKPSESQ